jgi:hypothetical protein
MIALGVLWLLSASVGGLIGRPKGIGSLGFVLGTFLGPLGWLIVLLLPGDPVRRITARPAGQGWHRDPLGRFDLRWFDGRHWTQHVQRRNADGALEAFEDIR